MAVRGAIEVAIAGRTSDERFVRLARVVASRYVPSLVLAGGVGAGVRDIALMEGRVSEEPVAYVCRGYACDAPTSDEASLGAQLDAIARGQIMG
jgi:uncharacterized protein YyaL (SSP411 family)